MKDGTEKLEHLRSMLTKYAHRWGECPSPRMVGWVDAYNAEKRNNPEAWKAYCARHDFNLIHDGYDCLA